MSAEKIIDLIYFLINKALTLISNLVHLKIKNKIYGKYKLYKICIKKKVCPAGNYPGKQVTWSTFKMAIS